MREFFVNLGTCGLLAALCVPVMTGFFLYGLRTGKYPRAPFRAGLLAVGLGLAGTAINVIYAFQRAEAMGGAASAQDLPDDLIRAPYPAYVGTVALGLGLVLSAVLSRRAARRAGEAADGSGTSSTEG
jgi:hypothetical protein